MAILASKQKFAVRSVSPVFGKLDEEGQHRDVHVYGILWVSRTLFFSAGTFPSMGAPWFRRG